jgi:hypothetical protein
MICSAIQVLKWSRLQVSLVIQVVEAEGVCVINPLQWYPMVNKMLGYSVQGGSKSQLVVIRLDGEGVTSTFDKQCVGV